MEQYTNDHGKLCYRGVDADTPFDSLEFHEVLPRFEDDTQWALHTNLGSLTVLDRLTGFGWRDIETGWREPDGRFWLASGNYDVRFSDAQTMADAIEWVKARANNCIGAPSYNDKP